MTKVLTTASSVLLVFVSFHWASDSALSSCVALAAMRTTPRILPLGAPLSSSSYSSSSTSSSSLLTACIPPPKNKYAALAAAVCVGTVTPQDATISSSQFETHRRALDWYAYTPTPTVAGAARTPDNERRGQADTARMDNEERKVVHLASWRPGNFVDGTMTDPPEE